MKLKTRLTVVYVFVISIIIIYGLYVGYSVNRIARFNDANNVVLSMNYNVSLIESSKLSYLLNKERLEASKVGFLLGDVQGALFNLDLGYIIQTDVEEIDYIKQGLMAYQDTFDDLFVQTNQQKALSTELEESIEALNELIIELGNMAEMERTEISKNLNLEVIGFYTAYLKAYAGQEIYMETMETHVDQIQTILFELDDVEGLSNIAKIKALRIYHQAKEILEEVNKFNIKKVELSETANRLSEQTLNIQQSLDRVTRNQLALIKKEETKILIMISIVLIGLLLILVTILGITFRLVVNNLNKLIKATEKITEGDYSTKIDVNDKDEFGELAASINQMANSLQISYRKNAEINEQLEYLVKERTQELQETKLDLEILNDTLQSEKERLLVIASTDELTSLLNRRAILNALDEEIKLFTRYQHPFTIMILDLDFFKNVNDEYGHIAGDEVLRKLSKVFIASVRDVDLVGRFGGEEFLFIFRNTVKYDAKNLIDRIKEASGKVDYSFAKIRLTFSAGVVQYQDENGVELLRKADKKLYEAKEKGRNLILYG